MTNFAEGQKAHVMTERFIVFTSHYIDDDDDDNANSKKYEYDIHKTTKVYQKRNKMSNIHEVNIWLISRWSVYNCNCNKAHVNACSTCKWNSDIV